LKAIISRARVRAAISVVALAGGVALPAVLAAQSVTQATPTGRGSFAVVHEAWTVVDGLPVNAINDLLQTRDGYIWAATFDGLVRFDGVRFTIFNTANSRGLPSDRILALREGGNGDIWLFTEQRSVVRLRAGRFTAVVPQALMTADGHALLAEADGRTWIGTARGLMQVVGDTLVPVLPTQIADTVVSVQRRRDGTLLVGMAHRGVVAVRTPPTGRFTAQSLAMGLMPLRAVVSSVFEDVRGGLWVSTDVGVWTGRNAPLTMVVRWKEPAATFDRFTDAPDGDGVFFYQYPVQYHVTGSGVVVQTPAALRPARWSDGRDHWHSTGATLLRNDDVVLSLAPARPGEAIPPHTISRILIDREGSVWLGTHAAGLHRLKPTLFRTYGMDEGLRDRNVYATYVDRRGDVWAGSWGRGLSRIAPASGVVTGFGSIQSPPFIVNSILEDRSGVLWVGGGVLPDGLYRCRREPTWRCTGERAGVTGFDDVRAMHEDTDGRLWVGSRRGLFRRDGSGWVRLDTIHSAPHTTVRAFAVSTDGAIWMGTDGGGVARYRDGSFIAVTTRDGLPGDVIRSLHVDGDGWLWIGTEGRGLARLDPRAWGTGATTASRRISLITSRDGLFDNVIHQILEDDAARLWMSTNRGIFWVPRAELMAYADGTLPRVQSTGYTERDGMRNREANGGVQPAGARGLDGRLWFPTQDGVVVVDPRTLRRDTVAPSVIVEQVIVGDTALLPTDGRVVLASSQRDVRIEFTALTFLEPRNVRFRYRLDGYDRGWVDAESRRSAFYTRLPPGTYAFEVQARIGRGNWQAPGASLTLEVTPRWFETTLFRITSLSALLALIVITIRRRFTVATERALELERVVEERTADLRERERLLAAQAEELQALDRARSRFFANVSHELRTPLTLTIGPIEDARNAVTEDPRVERWLDIALRNARRLLRLVNQILDVAKLEAGEMRLDPRPLDLSAFLRGLLGAFQPVSERKQITLELRAPEEYRVLLDADATEKIVTNLLSNAVKFTPPQGRVVVTLTTTAAEIAIEVRDSGSGIPADRLAHVFERFYQVDESITSIQPGTGIGLSLVKELVELQRGTVTVRSDGSGTVFTVTLPAAAPAPAGIPSSGASASRPALFVSTEIPTSLMKEALADESEPDVPTLLVVDDSADLRAYIRDHFDDRFRVLEAGDGAAGIALAREHLPDVILCDVMMPGTDGHALIQALRASPETDFLAVVLLTAMAEDEARLAGLEGGADDYLVKPFEMRELDVRVRNLIASRRRLRSRFAGEELPPPPAAVTVLEAHDTSLSPDDAAYLERVRTAIRSGLRDSEFGVSELARAVFQDRSHLFRRVRQVSGMSPSELLRMMRLEEGARLLAAGQGGVADVTYAVGYNSVSYFSRAFQAQYGVTPAGYRDQSARTPER